MELYRISIPKDDAWRVVEEIGNKHFAHFIDLNKTAQTHMLPYGFRVKQCDETERRIGYLLSKSREYKVPIVKPRDPASLDKQIEAIANDRQCAINLLFDSVDQDIREKERFVQDQIA